MKANQYSLKSYPIVVVFLLILISTSLTSVNAQCPTVTNSSQSFCDVESVLIGDLQAVDNGGGIVWYETATSTTPLSNSDSLINGEDYYADDNTGTCGARARVDIIIYGPPVGDNFQGVCLDDPTLATVGSLVAIGNDVQWYSSPFGGVPLNNSDILTDGTIYYADQSNPNTGCRTSRLSVLVNVGFTPVPVGDMIQEFCVTAQFTPTVGDLVASGNNNWYISLFSALPLAPNTPLINGQRYYATTLDPPCESSGRLVVFAVLVTGPNAGEDGLLDLCENDTSSTINLFNSLGGSPEPGGTWSPALNSGTGIFDPSIDSEGEYTYTVSSTNSCPDESATITVTLIPEPNAGSNGTIELCSNDISVDLFASLGGTPEIDGVWSPALTSGTGVFDPTVDPEGIYTYTISGISPCSDATATVSVSVTPYKDAGENGTIDLCNNNGTFDLFDSLGGSPNLGGIWSPALNSGTGVFDPALDAEGVYTYSFTGNSPCPNQSATVTVTVNPLPIAGSDATVEICSNDLTSIDLFTSLGGSPETGGTWSPALASGTGVFNPSVDAAGIYTYTLLGAPPCIDASAEVTVVFIPEPDAGIDATIDICSNDGVIDLFDSLNGTPDLGGTWSPALSSGTGIFDPTIDAIGTYTYTVSGTTPCADATASITITIIPFLNAGIDGSVIACTDDGSIDLFDSLGGTPQPGGTWSPTLNSGTGIFDPSIDTAGQYTYSTIGTAPCSDDSATIDVSVEISPDAGSSNTLLLCSLTNSVDLFDSLSGTPQLGGTWSPALNSGTGVFDPNTDPEGNYTYTITSICGTSSATLTVLVIDANDAGTDGAIELCTNDSTIDLFDSLGGNPDVGGTWSPALSSGTGFFDPEVDAEGSYTYSVYNSANLCPDASATVVVTVLQGPNPGNDGTLNLCNSTNTVDLFNSLAGTPDIGGTWSPALASGTGLFDPAVDAEGTYTYSLTNSCGTSSASVTVSLSNTNDAGTDGTIELCNTDASINLFDSLGGTPDVGGTWSPALTSGTGIFDPSIDAAGSYTYTISNSATPCPDASAIVIVSVLQGPNAGNDGTLNLCNSTNTVDLFYSLGGTPDAGGTWSPALASGTGLFDPTIDAEGIYSYTLNNSCGNSSATVTVSLTNTNDAGTDGAIELCDTDASINLFDSLGGTPDVGGTWSPALASGTGVFDPVVDTAGTYTYTVSNSATPCPDASATVIVSVMQGPNAGNDGILNLCNSTNTVNLFAGLTGNPDLGGTWSPALASGTGLFDPALDAEGTYTYSLTNSCGNSSATVTVSLSNTNDAGTDGTIELCNTDAVVNLFDSLGGTPDVGGTWSPALTSGTGVFNPAVDTAGTYTYTVSNSATPCPDASATVIVSILQGLNAGGDGTLNLCNSTNTFNLFDSLTGTPDAGGTWSPALASGTGLFDPIIDAEGIYTYTLSNSCGNSSATVTVSLSNTNDAGTDSTIELCNTDAAVNLFDSLGGTPDVGGTWSPALTSGTGIFNPAVDTAGTYTYTVSNSATPCPDASATVIVSVLQGPNAGNDGTLVLCNSTNTANLFDSLTGTPNIGGTWSPALASGTGVFDPTVDAEGIYTYTVSNLCGNSSATVTVSLSNNNDAGTDGTINLCNTDAAVNLFDSLGGTPDVGGTWSPALISGTGVFDPTVDAAGTYTYTVSDANSVCPDATANVVVTLEQTPNAGNDGTLVLCNSTNTVDLFTSLNGTPDTGGTWSPALTSGTGLFDPTVDAEGIYTYTINNSCGNSSATVSISSSIPNDAGTDGTIELCNTDTAVNLFDSLGGTPDVGGTWSPALTSGTGMFDPTVDAAGTYTYTVSDGSSVCLDATASVVVTLAQAANAGNDAIVNLCIDETNSIDLFTRLGGNPDTGGVWTPALTSGTGVFDPTTDAAGIYTYTVNSVLCNSTDTAIITININDVPDASGLTLSDATICFGSDAIINITGANQLADGDYTIVYQLSDANTSVNSVAISIIGGNSSFIVPQNLLLNTGTTRVTLSQIFILGQTCSANTQFIFPIKIYVIDPPTPQIISDGSEFCLEDNATIADLTNNTIGTSTIIWYNQVVGGTAYSSSALLEDNKVYYASTYSEIGCESSTRLEVTVSLISCVGELVIPDGFSPNGDSINDVFHIRYLDDLYPNFKLSIYNRYGNILYEGDINSPKWDGTWKNNNTVLPVGVYFYILEFNDGDRKPLQGRVYLSR